MRDDADAGNLRALMASNGHPLDGHDDADIWRGAYTAVGAIVGDWLEALVSNPADTAATLRAIIADAPNVLNGCEYAQFRVFEAELAATAAFLEVLIDLQQNRVIE